MFGYYTNGYLPFYSEFRNAFRILLLIPMLTSLHRTNYLTKSDTKKKVADNRQIIIVHDFRLCISPCICPAKFNDIRLCDICLESQPFLLVFVWFDDTLVGQLIFIRWNWTVWNGAYSFLWSTLYVIDTWLTDFDRSKSISKYQ